MNMQEIILIAFSKLQMEIVNNGLHIVEFTTCKYYDHVTVMIIT